MIDEIPTPKLAVYLFLEMIALGFVLEAVASLMHGDHWVKWVEALLAGIAFIILGIKSGKIIGFFSRKFPSRESFGRGISIGSRVIFVLAWLLVPISAYYSWTRALRVHKVIVEVGNSSNTQDNTSGTKQSEQHTVNIHAKDAPPNLPHKKASPSVLQPLPIQHVDWHDKQNWRKYLHTGMSRSEVRELFGEPRDMRVEAGMEFWQYEDYGAEIVFETDSRKDGSLFSWEEPR